MKDQLCNIFIVITRELVSFLSCVNFMNIANNYYHYRSKEMENAPIARVKWTQHPSGEG